MPPLPPALLNVVITGASSGVGAVLARALAARGHALYLTGRSAEALERVAAECRALGAAGVHTGAGDVASAADVARAWEAWGAPAVDVLCANAGLNRAGGIGEATEDDYDAIMGTNVKGVWLWLRQVLPGMRARARGQVVVTSSVLGLRAPAPGGGGAALYTASKHALQGLVAAARSELVGSGVKLATVCPAGIATPWWTESQRGGARERPVDTAALLPPEVVADAIVGVICQHPLCDVERVVLENVKPLVVGAGPAATAVPAGGPPATPAEPVPLNVGAAVVR
jgi:NADP-dependent 3-hydroxy acid dehydrogenase YdfG